MVGPCWGVAAVPRPGKGVWDTISQHPLAIPLEHTPALLHPQTLLLPPWSSWAAAAASPDIKLPQRNDYLPTDFSLRCEAQTDGSQQAQQDSATQDGGSRQNGAAKQQHKKQRMTVADGGNAAAASPAPEPESAAFPSPPALLLDAPGLRVWHKLDSAFRQPRAAAYLRLFSGAGYANPRAAAASHLVIKLLEVQLAGWRGVGAGPSGKHAAQPVQSERAVAPAANQTEMLHSPNRHLPFLRCHSPLRTVGCTV